VSCSPLMIPVSRVDQDGSANDGKIMMSQFFNSIQFFIIYVLNQQLQSQLQTQHSADIHNYIMDTLNIESRINCRST
jgi:hypothetical protein